MIKCEFTTLDNDIILEIQGHADYNKGNDIVCSGVSALAYTLAGALRVAEVPIEFKDQSGDFLCGAKLKDLDVITYNKVRVIYETISIGLLQIEKTYPKNVEVKFNS